MAAVKKTIFCTMGLPGLVVMMAAAGCSEGDFKTEDDKPRSMSVSTGQYSVGYRDGMREATQSWFDDHAGWMWLWMKDPEYGKGYERGWADGRRKVGLESQQQQSDKQTEEQAQEQAQEN